MNFVQFQAERKQHFPSTSSLGAMLITGWRKHHVYSRIIIFLTDSQQAGEWAHIPEGWSGYYTSMTILEGAGILCIKIGFFYFFFYLSALIVDQYCTSFVPSTNYEESATKEKSSILCSFPFDVCKNSWSASQRWRMWLYFQISAAWSEILLRGFSGEDNRDRCLLRS